MAVRCPKCSASIDATPDALGLVTCSSCGARLRTRQPVKVTVQAPAPAALPPIDPSLAAPADMDHILSRIDTPSADSTIRMPAMPKKPDAGLERVLAELRIIRTTQQEILSLLKGRPSAAGHQKAEGRYPETPATAVTNKVVLLVDDDAEVQAETASVLRALANVTTASDGNDGLASIALAKPDAIVLELDIGGAMPGHDFVNLLKATMDWIDIPLLLHTRLDLGEEATTLREHGADVIVRKGPGSAEALAARLGALFGVA